MNKINLFTAISIVVANMVGTGVFTSLGFQVKDIQSVFSLLVLWGVGGIVALCGALSYGELGATIPRSGGEYHFLSRIYHPSLGFVSGWVSATVGFAAPVALVCLTFGEYINSVHPNIPVKVLAMGLLILVASIHINGVKSGSKFQGFFTAIKVVLILGFIGIVLASDHLQSVSVVPKKEDIGTILSTPFAVSLIYVSYAYTGWNAAAYLIDELVEPQKNLPIALFIGTGIVTILYVLLNYTFLLSVPMEELVGKVEIGYISATSVMGEEGGKWMAITLAILLVSTASAMTFAGPRVLAVIGEDYTIFKFLTKRNKNGSPVRAILFQSFLSLGFILLSSFEEILIFASFVLALMTFLTVSGVYKLRIQEPELPRPYKVWGYPITPAIYLLLVGYNAIFLIWEKPYISITGFMVLISGLVIYFIREGLSRS